MSNDSIDASLGLAFSLELFKRYRKNGVLQARIPRMPGVRGSCHAFLHLVNGEIVSVYIEDKQGQHHSSDRDTLCRLDREKGPFEWALVPQPAPAHPTPPHNLSDPLTHITQRSPVPHVISVIPHSRLRAWTPQQKDALRMVLAEVNGERSIEDIKTAMHFPPDLVDELLRILLELNVISMST